MTTGALMFPLGYAPTDNGAVVASGRLYFFRTGTTTAMDTYSDSALATPNANPVVLNTEGYLDTKIYGNPASGYDYRVRLTDSAAVQIWQVDDVSLSGTTTHDVSTEAEPGFLVFSNYATASRQANITSITYGVSGGGTIHVNHANGTYAAPTATLSAEITGGIGSRTYHSGGAFQTSSPAAIHWQVTENQTSSAYGMWIRFLTTPKTSTTRQEVGGITDNQTIWSHDTATYDATSSAQTLPHADARFVASANTNTGATFVSVGYGTGVTPGFRGMHARGTPASRTATQSGDMLAFISGHGYGTSWTSGANALIAAYAQENFSGSAAGTRLSFETTPSTTTTRAEAARFDASVTATHTRFMIYDVDNGTLERVTVGAADSGGAGFKVLRIPN